MPSLIIIFILPKFSRKVLDCNPLSPAFSRKDSITVLTLQSSLTITGWKYSVLYHFSICLSGLIQSIQNVYNTLNTYDTSQICSNRSSLSCEIYNPLNKAI